MRGIIFFVLLLVSEIASGQKATGIFLTVDTNLSNCKNKYVLLNGLTEHCLSNEPAIKFEEFAGVSEIYYHPTEKKRLLDIHLTPKGSKLLKTITTTLGYKEIAIVVNGKLVSVIGVDGAYRTRSISIWDQYDTKTLEWIHKSLIKHIPRPGEDLKFRR